MTNSEMWVDGMIHYFESIKLTQNTLNRLLSYPNCNTCRRDNCEYKPKAGEDVRINCPLHIIQAERKGVSDGKEYKIQ